VIKRTLQERPELAGVIARSRVEEPVVLQKPTNAIRLNNRIAQSLGLISEARAAEIAVALTSAGPTTIGRG
jgi:hypothetical protein